MGLSFKEKVKVYVSKARWLGGLSVKVRVLDNEKKEREGHFTFYLTDEPLSHSKE